MGLTQKLGTIPLAIFTDASNNVGIGGAPSTKFQVTGTIGNFQIASSGAEIFLTRNENNDILATGGTSSGITLGAQSFLKFKVGTSYTERMIINSSGNIGINTSSVSEGTQASGSISIIPVSSVSSAPLIQFPGNGRIRPASTGDRLSIDGNALFLNSTFGGNIIMATGGGNVGIGKSSPACRLDILGTNEVMNISGTNATSAYTGYYYNTSTLVGYIGNGSSILSGAASSDFIFRSQGALVYATNGNNERMRLTSTGVLLITSSVSGQLVNINNTRNNGSGDFALVTTLGSNDANTSNYHYIASTGGADRMYVYGNGNIVNINNSYGTLSDISLKENIVDATPKLNDILNLKVRNFNLIADETKTKQIGFIAQEFEEVFPAMVDWDEKTEKKTIKTSVLVPMLVKAIQELNAKVSALENKS